MRSVLIACVVTGCWSSAEPVPAPPTPVALAPLPPCPMRLDESGHLLVGEVDVGEFVAPDGNHGPRTLAIYQTGTEAFVSYREPESDGGPAGGDLLWKVSCAGMKLDQIADATANFGFAALHPDRKRLFYTGRRGVMMIDLVTRQRTEITTGGKTEHCWENGPTALADVVHAVTKDHVELARGGPCGFEAEYSAVLLRRHLETGVEETSTSVIGIAQVGNAVWIVAGRAGTGCKRAIYRSVDWRSWTQVAIDTPSPAAITVEQGRITVTSQVCSVMSEMPAMVSLDGGATWTPDHDLPKVEPTTVTRATIHGRTVRLGAFGLFDARTTERLFPR